MNPGSIVRCRNREWVLLPSDSHETHLLRPLTGALDDVVAIHRRLSDLQKELEDEISFLVKAQSLPHVPLKQRFCARLVARETNV